MIDANAGTMAIAGRISSYSYSPLLTAIFILFISLAGKLYIVIWDRVYELLWKIRSNDYAEGCSANGSSFLEMLHMFISSEEAPHHSAF